MQKGNELCSKQSNKPVEVHGMVFWTRVRLPSTPLDKLRFSKLFLFRVAFRVAYPQNGTASGWYIFPRNP